MTWRPSEPPISAKWALCWLGAGMVLCCACAGVNGVGKVDKKWHLKTRYLPGRSGARPKACDGVIERSWRGASPGR